MNAAEFIELVKENQDQLGGTEHYHPGMCSKGCPLRVAMMNWCRLSVRWRELFCGEPGRRTACNPDPMVAARHLYLEESFAGAVAHAWDENKFYGDAEEEEELLYEFAGFLAGVSFCMPPRRLPEATCR